jgi:hypothetical protein
MTPKKRPPHETHPVSPEQAIARYAVLDRAIQREDRKELIFDEMESAIGMYVMGFYYGWKVLHLIHTKKTIAKYEEILGIKVRETFPEFGPYADRTNAYKIIQKVTNFWRLVSGERDSPMPELDKRVIF